MNLSEPFIRRPVMTTFVMLAILILGWISYTHLPVSDLPTVERPRIHISAGYPGASPENVLNQVTIPLEKELTQVKGVQEMSSTSSSGHSSISLDFELSKNMDQAIRDVQAALNRAEVHLPIEIDPRPTYSRQEGNQESIMHLLLMSDNGNVGELRNYADTYIIPRLNRIEGIGQAQVYGSGGSIWVRLNPELMAVRHIGFNQVIQAIQQQASQVPLGSIQTASKSFSIEIPATVLQPKDLANIYIGGNGVHLKDIAEITDKPENEQEFFLVTADKRNKALIISIQKINDGNTVAIANAVEKVVTALQKELPSTIQLSVWFNKAVWIKESIVDVEWTLLFAFILVVVVIYLSLGRISEALIPSAALPMSLIGTFAAMYILDFSLDLLSLLALTLSVGFVVDDAIVVLENIVRNQELGKNPFQASLEGSRQICFTVLTMTLSLVAVFIPLLFMEGMTGRLFREFSVTLAISILVSGFVSLTLTPMLCSRFLGQHSKVKTKVQDAVTRINGKMVDAYGRSLNKVLHYSKTILFGALLCVLAMIPLFQQLSVSLVPPEDRGFVIAFISLPTGTSPSEIRSYQEKLEGLIKDNPYIKDILDFNFEGNLLLLVRLIPQAERPPQEKIIGELEQTFNKVAGIHPFIQGYNLINLDLDVTGAQYKYVLKGPDFEAVRAATEELAKTLQENSAILFAQSSIKNDAPQLTVNVNQEQAYRFGLSKRDIQSLLQRAYGKSAVASIQQGVQEKKIYMELQSNYRGSPTALNKLYLLSPEEALIPLKAVATWEEQLGASRIGRRDQLPSASIHFNLNPEIATQKGLQIVEDIASQTLPSGISGHLGHSAQAVASTINKTLFLLLAAAIVMYVVLGILYESFIHPLTILSSLPFAAFGGILTLLLFREPISIFSAVGFLLLIGIVKKNGIMMVDYALEAQQQGLSPRDAIIEGCRIRFRPIMMTTIAAVMGALPIAIGFGDGAEIRRGLGLVIVGGLLFAQLLTLYVTPVLYLCFSRLSKQRPTKVFVPEI